MTAIKWRKPGKWMTLIPSADIVRQRIRELQEELRQLGILLKTAEELELEQEHATRRNEVANAD